MLCEKCKKKAATLHVKTTLNNQVRESDLCSTCAQKMGFSFLGEFGPSLALPPFQALSKLMSQLVDEGTSLRSKKSSARCSHCGLTYEDFRNQGRFGCAHCYDSFQKEIQNLLIQIHGQDQHKGKTYHPSLHSHDAPPGGGRIKTQEVERLQKELRVAVQKEEFERAAELRDQLKRLKGK